MIVVTSAIGLGNFTVTASSDNPPSKETIICTHDSGVALTNDPSKFFISLLAWQVCELTNLDVDVVLDHSERNAIDQKGQSRIKYELSDVSNMDVFIKNLARLSYRSEGIGSDLFEFRILTENANRPQFDHWIRVENEEKFVWVTTTLYRK